jgi:hypothetical protein
MAVDGCEENYVIMNVATDFWIQASLFPTEDSVSCPEASSFNTIWENFMLRQSVAAAALAAVFWAGGGHAFAAGTVVGGHGINTSSPGGVGRASTDGLSSVGFSSGSHAGSVGLTQTVSSNNFNRTSGDTFSTGGVVHSPGGIGRGTDYVTSEKLPTLPVVRGVGIVSSAPGGRGF